MFVCSFPILHSYKLFHRNSFPSQHENTLLLLPFALVPTTQKQVIFWRRIYWILPKTEHHKNPLFQYLSLFETLFSKWNNWYQSCSCGLLVCIFKFRIGTFTWEERTSYKNSFETQSSTLNPGYYPKISFCITVWEHSLNVMKCWVLQNTLKSL